MAIVHSHEMIQDLLERLERYRQWVADAEYRAETKNPEIMEGLKTIEAAAAFIKGLDAETQAQAEGKAFKMDIAAEFDNDLF